MTEAYDPVLVPQTYSELFADWNRRPEAVPFAGGTALLGGRDGRKPKAPAAILSLEKIEEMQRITRSERYLEIGATVKLSRIVELGKFVPGVLVKCLRSIAGPQLRNMATIGGNVCGFGDGVAAFTALDAQYGLRSAQSSRWITASRFLPAPSPDALNPRELLSRIRVPLDNWEYSTYKKFAGDRSAVFLAKPQKDVLADIRIVCKTGDRTWRNKDGETLLIGKRLPLTRRMAAAFVGRWEAFLRGAENADGLSRKELVNFIETNVDNLAE